MEAYHAANIRLQIAQSGLTSPPPTPLMCLRRPPESYFAIDTTNALAIIRTPRQVLNIVLANTGTTGGFFPSGTNANLATLTSLAGGRSVSVCIF